MYPPYHPGDDYEEPWPRWKLTEYEEEHRIKKCPKCGSTNLDPAGGWNSANGYIKCYDCGHGPFWWLRPLATSPSSNTTGDINE